MILQVLGIGAIFIAGTVVEAKLRDKHGSHVKTLEWLADWVDNTQNDSIRDINEQIKEIFKDARYNKD